MQDKYPKSYTPGNVEKKWYEIWQKSKIYIASADSPKPAYSILMPPPNITGILHFGHVLNITIQDIYIRWKRMSGYEVCWFPGTDHAGIATQTRVEKELAKEGLTRYDLGREKFLERVWKWKEEYGGIILRQLRELGISCDWSRTLFTMDESASNAVREVFIRLFDEGLIYRGKRIINWSPLSRTALSDEEVEFREVKEYLYTLRYYFVDSDDYLLVATVRPETIFGDVAVAVNPNDERYKHLIGKKVLVPLANREVPIVADEYADPTFGTGCVKITPAHDPNDFEVGQRHSLPIINSINPDGTLNEFAGEFNGLERFEARKKIVEKLKEKGLIEKIEDYVHNVGFSQRGGEPIEPYLSDQWFVRMKPLAEIALKPVLEGKIKFYPKHWEKTYQHWLENVRDWCISRQLWWGHRIPVYYTPDGRYTAARGEEHARTKLGISQEVPLEQDPDVLDTWFSSWLWPLTTMRWLHDGVTEETADLKKFLPTDLLVTAPDIIFFWVARMIMATMKFKNEIPFKDVYFTSTIRDGLGRKLSKSLGNSPDPLKIIEKYGADATRFTMTYLSPLGQDVRMEIDVKTQDIPSMEIGRNFANKIWNAGRFLLMKRDMIFLPDCCPENVDRQLRPEELSYADKWILSRLHSTIEKVNRNLENYRINDYAKLLYDFIWRDFCDWYVEILKVELKDSNEISFNQALIRFALEIFENILKLIHPVMPFVSEELWHLLTGRTENESISIQSFPTPNQKFIDESIENNFEVFQFVVEEIRKLRNEVGIEPAKKVDLIVSTLNSTLATMFEENKEALAFLSRANEVSIVQHSVENVRAITSVVREVEIHLLITSDFDISKEKERIAKELERLKNNISSINNKLNNPAFLEKAKPEIIEREKAKLASMNESLEKLQKLLERLSKL
ncbi:valine--tRNA ligase [Bacteroidetes/Chlorobi group bacterium Naka2016]|jgi:valyl-tRNA synthetase|nr:MAG: valine--tRNA ligase [Bacteroidetes/Chlorobi group bacterium Naka2016]